MQRLWQRAATTTPGFRRNCSVRAMTAARNTTTEEAVRFSLLLEQLKVQKRTGWVRMNVEGAESIADHMYRMGVMALVAGEASGLDPYRCMQVAIAHDIAEAIVGDITPHCGVSKQEKQRRERAAIEQIQEMLGGTCPAAVEVRELWEEYEANSSPVALLVKDLDKLEMILQAYEYERAQGGHLQEFFDSTSGKFRTAIGQQWAAEVVQARRADPTGAAGEPAWSSELRLFSLISNLKRTKRKGWVIKHIPDAESIADHMYRMALLAMVGAHSSGVDPSRAVAMALVHDLAEAVVGDITPHCGVSAEEKYQREQTALRSLTAMVQPQYPATAKLIQELWEEFEAGTTAVALLVTDLDKLEMIVQAHQYEQRHGVRLQEFFDATASYFKTPTVKQWAEEVQQLRQEAAAAAPAVAAAISAAEA